MSNRKPNKSATCIQCGKLLQQVTCPSCGGKGFNRKLVFFKEGCDTCQETGKILRCPDYYKHFLGRTSSVTTKLQPIKPLTRLKPLDSSSPQVPPPWHPSNPNVSHPMHPRSPLNPNNPFSPVNPSNPNNPNSPMNPMNPNKPFKK